MYAALRKKTSVLSSLMRFAMSGGGHHARPTKLQKVDSKLVWLNVKNAYGAYERVPCFEGESMMDALVRSKTPGYQTQCLGGDPTYRMYQRPLDPMRNPLGCNVCRVIIEEPWYSRMNGEIGKADVYETAKLEENSKQDPRMRMSCCIPIEKWMDNMNVQIVETFELDQL